MTASELNLIIYYACSWSGGGILSPPPAPPLHHTHLFAMQPTQEIWLGSKLGHKFGTQ